MNSTVVLGEDSSCSAASSAVLNVDRLASPVRLSIAASLVTMARAVWRRRTCQTISIASRNISGISVVSSHPMMPSSQLRSMATPVAIVYQVRAVTSCHLFQAPRPKARAKAAQPRWYGMVCASDFMNMAITHANAHTVHPMRRRQE